VGLLGGSFDPPHRGHIYISLEAKKLLSLDEIWWIVTPQNPLKITRPATFKERVNNCKNIVKNYPIIIKEIEKKIKSKYSFYTVEYLINHYSNIKFFWLMGADNLINFHQWQKWKEFFNKISVVIFKRYGYNNAALKSIALKTFDNYLMNSSELYQTNFHKLPSWTFIKNKEIRISSSEIRKHRKILKG